jgi:hypothetical protein
VDKEEDLVSDVIEGRKKLSKNAKEKILNLIFYNCIFFIVMMIITLIINISFNKLLLVNFEEYIKVIQIGVAIVSVVLFEMAYRKDTMKIGCFGIEFVIFSIAILFVPYMYISKSNIKFLKLIVMIFAIYYIVKSIVYAFFKRYEYLKDNMSDVKEIVKDEKESYLDEDSKKTLKERKIQEENKVKKIKNIKKQEKQNKKMLKIK